MFYSKNNTRFYKRYCIGGASFKAGRRSSCQRVSYDMNGEHENPLSYCLDDGGMR